MRIHRDDRGSAERVMRWRLLLLAPVTLLFAAAPEPWTTWYSLTAEDGRTVGYGFVESDWTPGMSGRPYVQYQQVWIRKGSGPAALFTDRIVSRTDNFGRPIELFERIQTGGDWAEYRTTMGPNAAVITRTTRNTRRIVRVKLPSRIFARGLYAPSRCVSTSGLGSEIFELNPGDGAVDRVVYADARQYSGNDMMTLAQRYRGTELRGTDRLSYNGDCQLNWFTTTRAGVKVTVKLTDRDTALRGAMVPRQR